MLSRIDHLGIAVRSIEERIGFWTCGLGLTAAHVEVVPTERVRVAMLTVGESRIELLEPTSPDSPVAKFLSRRGEGIHHVCFAVEDLEAALADLAGKGFRLVHAAPVEGADGKRVAFLHPEAGRGVLIELSEEGRKGRP